MALLTISCGGKGSSGPSQATVERVTAAGVTSVLKAHNETLKGAITCVGVAPGIIDCHGTTTNGDEVQATLDATTAGQTCQGPLVVNVKGVKLDAVADEKCA